MEDFARLARVLVLASALTASALSAADPAVPRFALATTLAVGGEGRWDYIAYAAASDRLYVPRSTHVMVLDATSGALVADIPGTKGVHGVALVPEVGRGFTSNGGDGTVTIFDLKTAAVLGSVAAKPDADCIIYDPASRKVLAFCGDAEAVVAIPADVAVSGAAGAAVDLGGKPEYAVADGHGKVYVNLVDKDQVAVLDTATMTVTARWPTAPGARPTGMAMDLEGRRLIVGCRNQKLVVMGADGGRVLADLPIGPGVDATAFSAGCALASCGDATLSVARADAAGHFAIVQTVTTLPGARTMAVDPTGRRIWLPTAELEPVAASAANPHPRPTPKAGTFKLVVVARDP
jgi:DNA-binding beta-propeller fold protein YncE